MKFARVVFRSEGVPVRTPGEFRSAMFDVDFEFRPTTIEQCRVLEEPIRRALTKVLGVDSRTVEEVWFSRPEDLLNESIGQDVVVDGGVTKGGAPYLRLTCEIHHSFCNCAYCGDEDIVADEICWL